MDNNFLSEKALVGTVFGLEDFSLYPYIYRKLGESKIGETVNLTINNEAQAAVKIPINEEIQDLLEDLNEREKRILTFYFGLEDGKIKTQKETAKEFKVSRARIGQIVERAIRKLRYPSRSRRLREFLVPTPLDRYKEREKFNRLETRVAELIKEKSVTKEEIPETRDILYFDPDLDVLVKTYAGPLYRRVRNALRRGGINNPALLKKANERELYSMRNVGKKTLGIILQIQKASS